MVPSAVRAATTTGRSNATIRSTIVCPSLMGTSTPPAPSTIHARSPGSRAIDSTSGGISIVVPFQRAARCGDTGVAGGYPIERARERRHRPSRSTSGVVALIVGLLDPGLDRLPVPQWHVGPVAEHQRRGDDGFPDVGVGAGDEQAFQGTQV